MLSRKKYQNHNCTCTDKHGNYHDIKFLIIVIAITKNYYLQLFDGLRLTYGGGTTNLPNSLEAKHPVSYKKAVPGEATVQKKQTTLGVFQAKTCPPARANTITTLVAEFVSRYLRLVSTVDGKGFQQLLGYMEPGYKIPSHPHVATMS